MSDIASPATGIPIESLTQTGGVPETRFKDAAAVCDCVDEMRRANDTRAGMDAKVKGLVDGNPPFKKADLRAAGQSWRANANFREAEAMLASAQGAFYDVMTEAPTLATVELDFGPEAERGRISRIVTEEFDRTNKEDRTLDSRLQLSQHEMVLYGLGPMIWENEFDFRARAVPKSQFLIPDGTECEMDAWEVFGVLVDYKPHELYNFIKDGKAARTVGWNTEAVKRMLVNAAPKPDSSPGGPDWMFLQQQIRNNDLGYSARSKVIRTAHVWWREFPEPIESAGRITHVIVPADAPSQGGTPEYLYEKQKQYADWEQTVCPFYYDQGDGTHHSVKGIGVKFYGALELRNRMFNAMIDAGNERTKIVFQAASPEAAQSFQIVPAGPYSLVPTGATFIPMQQGSVLQDPLLIMREINATVTANLSQYRQNLEREKGNPITAREVQARAEQQSLLGKTQLSRYYAQLDAFWSERYRRIINRRLTTPLPGGKQAEEFRKRCYDRGVPLEALSKVKSVRATRVAGQGNPFLRIMAIQNLLQFAPMFGGDGRMALLEDLVAAQTGQSMVARYVPASDKAQVATHDSWEAAQEHTSMKVGNPTPVVGSQNHVVHVESHMAAGVQALNSLQQGADPGAVLQFIDQDGPHIAAHLNELAGDPTRKREFSLLEDQFKDFSKATDQLRDDVQKNYEQQQKNAAGLAQAAAIAGGMDPNTAIKAAQAQADAKLKSAKVANDIALKRHKTSVDLSLKDAKTAAGIRMAKSKQVAQTALAAQAQKQSE